MKELQEVPFWLWILVAAVLMVQGTLLFRDAQRRGKGRMAWFWGIWGITGAPTPAVCYLLLVVLPDRRKRNTGRQR